MSLFYHKVPAVKDSCFGVMILPFLWSKRQNGNSRISRRNCKSLKGRGVSTAFFTLIEVVIALAVLSLGVVSYLTLANSAQRRLLKAKEKWMNFHMLSQAVEYYMLYTSDDPLPPDAEFFDYPGYRVTCRYEDAAGLEDDFLNVTENQAKLRACVFELIREKDMQIVDSVTIDRIDYENTEQSNSAR